MVFWLGLGDPFVSQRILYIWFSRTNSGLCIYHLSLWSNFNLLHNSQWITFPTQSFILFMPVYSIHLCDLLFELCHLLIYTTCYFVYYLFLLWHNWFLWYYFVLLLRNTISFLWFPFLSHVQVISCVISFVCLLKYPLPIEIRLSFSYFDSYFDCPFIIVLHLLLFTSFSITSRVKNPPWYNDLNTGLWHHTEFILHLCWYIYFQTHALGKGTFYKNGFNIK